MNNDEQSAERLLGATLDLPPERRSAFVDQACRESPELRRMVEELLFRNGFLKKPLLGANPEPAETVQVNGHLAAGTKLGRYAIIEPLGAGGMGFVYRARDERLERAVAIKILAPGLLRGEDARRRFHKEALALAKLSSVHIAAVYDVGEEDGVDYIVMECVPGESLATKLRSGPLTVKEATSITLQIAEALEEAHEQGVIHRDLKPANVMITPKGQVKVLDFGLAKLRETKVTDATLSIMETQGILGTPLYMSPEQAHGKTVDTRTDLWSLGVVYYEMLTGCTPFHADGIVAVLRAITEKAPTPMRQIRFDAPPLADQIVTRALEKDPAVRYQSASEVIRDTSELQSQMSSVSLIQEAPVKRRSRTFVVSAAVVSLLAIAASIWLYQRWSNRGWAREEAVPQITSLLASNKPLAAFWVLEKAERYLPSDPRLKQVADERTITSSITSSPSGATVEIQDYAAPTTPWHRLGTTPLNNVRIPKGYFLWRVSKSGGNEMVVAPETNSKMNFLLGPAQGSPNGMVPVPADTWEDDVGFVGWLGPYRLPPYYVDRYEVTNRAYQNFVDSGGYEEQKFWMESFRQNGRTLSWSEAMVEFRDTTGRPGPATWVAGHYPEGRADYPVSGVSWFEASAYAAFAGKRLPVLSQWFQTAPAEFARYTVPASNMSGKALAPVGTYPGIGPYGTYDTAGNVREWVANEVDDNLRFILGGAWNSASYLYFDPEALSPFDRSETNGFRCVRNLGPLPEETATRVVRKSRDFAHHKPISDTLFHAYELLYAYPKTMALNVKTEGVIAETADWREEKVSFDTAYRGERMAAYLFLPKNVRPPYQTVIFFPSARVMFIPDNKGGHQLGDINFFDYVVQSGRAVMYPIYQDTYERRVKFSMPGGAQWMQITTDWYKDVARSVDYLGTRPDIDSSRLAYMGVSMGSAEGIFVSALLQDRLKTAVLLDGGFFLDQPPPGGDEADFAARIKIPVLMVNGRYDFTFPLDRAQNPLFTMLGTRAEDKSHVVLDTPHDVTEQRPQLVKAVLDWLDRYLGRVKD
jgi:serine/threonine protein kinase/formylglycine-generating enzyme required for sulfatase activity/dienelactone hydrolase